MKIMNRELNKFSIFLYNLKIVFKNEGYSN